MVFLDQKFDSGGSLVSEVSLMVNRFVIMGVWWLVLVRLSSEVLCIWWVSVLVDRNSNVLNFVCESRCTMDGVVLSVVGMMVSVVSR